MRDSWKFLCAFTVGAVATLFVLHPPITSQDWAAWLQAVGSGVGIAIAIAVPYNLHRASVQRDTDHEAQAIRHDLQSIKDELDVTLEGLLRTFGTTLDDALPDGIYHCVVRPDIDGMIVFRAIANRIGRIPQQNLRRGIVRVYAMLQTFILDLHHHADIWDALLLNETRMGVEKNSEPSVRANTEIRYRLRQISASVQTLYKETTSEMVTLVGDIDVELARPCKN